MLKIYCAVAIFYTLCVYLFMTVYYSTYKNVLAIQVQFYYNPITVHIVCSLIEMALPHILRGVAVAH